MKNAVEIRSKIKELQRQMNVAFSEKREAKNESVTMRQIDEQIDGLGKQIRILLWVVGRN